MNLINPNLAINIIRKQIKKQLKKEIKDFDIMYFSGKNHLDFIIDGEKLYLENTNLINLIKTYTKKHLNKSQAFDLIIVNIRGENLEGKIFYTSTDIKGVKKEFVKFNL